jgi:hypothetical protein
MPQRTIWPRRTGMSNVFFIPSRVPSRPVLRSGRRWARPVSNRRGFYRGAYK